MPWPEECFRIEIDRVSDLLFAPTELAAANLRRENLRGAIAVTGNTGIDALLEVERSLPSTVRDNAFPSILVTCHRRESWGAGLAEVAAAVRELASRGTAAFDVLLHPNAHVAGAMRRQLGGCGGVRLVAPCSHRELVQRMRAADLVLSDSGGMQEEAPALGVPMLVLRSKTERPEGIASGNAILVGTERATIVAAVRRLLADPAARAAMARKAFPYGDGKAAPRIAAIIAKQLGAAAAA